MTRLRPLLVLAALGAGCAKTPPPATPAADAPRQVPAPLPERPFEMPEVHRATLSNGLQVLLVENHEVPLWNARLVVRAGAYADPEGKEGLASVTFDMMDEGAGGRDAAALARELKRLGGSIGSGAGLDSAAVSVSGPKRTLEPLLDLFADVVLRPDFPASEWEILQARRIADLRASLEDPTALAYRVLPAVAYGDAYQGRLTTEAAYRAITRADMRSFHAAALQPDQAVLLVGGDVTLDEVVPLLEERLGGWNASAPPVAAPEVTPRPFEREVIYFVDKPGAAQSVLLSVLPVNTRADADHWDLLLGNTAFGGAFTARVNMNLREEKGWTYGARCGLSDNLGPSLWYCATSVQTDKTVPALQELRREVAEVVGDRPITEEEVRFFQSFRVNSFYGRYETPGALLGQLADVWIYDLPEDWLERYVPGIQGVTAPSANAALERWIRPGQVAWVVVGDEAQVRDDLAGLGVPLVELDRDAQVVTAD